MKTTCHHELTGSSKVVYCIDSGHWAHGDDDPYMSVPTKCLWDSGPLSEEAGKPSISR